MSKFVFLKSLRELLVPLKRLIDKKAEAPNWNENDPASASYIANRTHYKEEKEKFYLNNEQISFSNGGPFYVGEANLIGGTLGDIFTVIWDGTEYQCKVGILENMYVLGNQSIVSVILGTNLPDTGEPFIYAFSPGEYANFFTLSTASSHTVSLFGIGEIIHKIPTEFLPEISSVGKEGTGENAEIFNDYEENRASGIYSHAEGRGTSASGDYSHAEGLNSTASWDEAHAEGYDTTASGTGSHSEGVGTIASGSSAHAEGNHTTASGHYSHAEGYSTRASSQYQHVQGKYNLIDSVDKYAHIVGNGSSSSARKNAHTLDWNGLGWFAGGVKVGGTGQDDTNAKALATETYVDNKIAEIPTPDYPVDSVNGKTGTVVLSASDVGALPNTTVIPSIEGLATETYVDNKIATIPTPDVSGQISTHNTSTTAHPDIRTLITNLTTRLNTLADSDDTTLDQLSEIVAYIKDNKDLIEGVTTSKVNVSDIIDNLTTEVTNKPLSANQGVILKGLIDALRSEVDSIDYPVDSVNGKTGEVVLTAEDVGAIADIEVEPYYHLVTNRDGEKVWEEKLAYSDHYEEELGSVETSSFIAYFEVETPLSIDKIYTIIHNGVEFKCQAQYLNSKNDYVLGNASIYTSSGTVNTGETFVFVPIFDSFEESTLYQVWFPEENTSNNLSLKYVEDIFKEIPGEFVAGGITSGSAEKAQAFNALPAENASGISSVAMNNSLASGDYSHAEGDGTIASGYAQHVQGKYNIEDTENKYLHIVGNGDSEIRSNAHTVDNNGLGWFAGGLKVGGTGQDDAEAYSVATEHYVIYQPKNSIIFIDQETGYKYIGCIRNGNFVTYCAVKSIELVNPPNKTAYIDGECFDTTGMVIKIIYDDNTEQETTNYFYTDDIKEDTTEIEIKYNDSGFIHTIKVPITVSPFDPQSTFIDFNYTDNNDGTYTLTSWKGTLNGETSTEIIIPDNKKIILSL